MRKRLWRRERSLGGQRNAENVTAIRLTYSDQTKLLEVLVAVFVSEMKARHLQPGFLPHSGLGSNTKINPLVC